MIGFIGDIVEPINDERSRIFGSCFAFGSRHVFITADHVVTFAASKGARSLHVIGPGLWPTPCVRVHRHPTLDVAALIVPHGADLEPFRTVADSADGDDVWLHSADLGTHGSRVVDSGWWSPPRRNEPDGGYYAFDAYRLATAPGKGYSGAPVFSRDGSVSAVLTHAIHPGTPQAAGVALRFSAARPWLNSIRREYTP